MSKYNQPLNLDTFMKGLIIRNPGQPEFHQAVQEVADKLIPYINAHPQYLEASILERLSEPDRVLSFRVCWEDDKGNTRVNRGYRIQFNNSIGPYKGGLRFDKSVNLGILKFLGFEQIFKNSLTTLPMGGAKGGSNFNPKGKSDLEIMRFCQSFMTQLYTYIGPNQDVPAGDIGVGAREISYLFGQYKRLTGQFTGTLTGKSLDFGGSPIRKEATGYGLIYFAREMLSHHKKSLASNTALLSGSGNVALYAAQKLIEFGAKVLSLSDREGTLYLREGLTNEQLNEIIEHKIPHRKPLKEYAQKHHLSFLEGQSPWQIEADMAFPCATQNEISLHDAKSLIKNGCQLVAEGANMPTESLGMRAFEASEILYAPGKAANAGGVAISGLEMAQNSMHLTWTREDVDRRLQKIMTDIHAQCSQYGQEKNRVNYITGANVGGFVKVANAMLAYGIM